MALSIPWLHKKQAKKGRIGLSAGPDGLGVAYINAEQELVFTKFFANPGDVEQLLRDLVVEQGWQDMPCSMVLHPVYYQLLLTEAPQVPANELCSAVRWKVKEFLDFPIEEAAIEYFSLPDDAYRGRQKMLYVAVLRKSTLQSLVDPVEASGLSVDCIEVSELALHNLFSRLPAERGGSAVVQLCGAEGFINLVEDGAIYLCRRIEIGIDGFQHDGDNAKYFEALLLEIQRSMDFYESQLGKGIVSHLYLAPDNSTTSQIGGFLSSQLGLNVEPLDVADLGMSLEDADSGCIDAIGAAMQPRKEKEPISAAH